MLIGEIFKEAIQPNLEEQNLKHGNVRLNHFRCRERRVERGLGSSIRLQNSGMCLTGAYTCGKNGFVELEA